MPLVIEPEQQAMVSHRMHFWGRPTSSSTVSWQYQGQPWRVRRPADGRPALQRTVRCAVCGKRLEYSVHSVAVSRRRRGLWRAGALAGLALLVAGVVALFALGGDTRIMVGFALILVGAVLGNVGRMGLAAETGVTGHGASWPGATKHDVSLGSASTTEPTAGPTTGSA